MIAGGTYGEYFFLYVLLTEFHFILQKAVFTLRTYCIYGRRLGPAILLVALFALELGVKLVCPLNWMHSIPCSCRL